MTATRPARAHVPEHGSRSGYLRGCGCDPCRTAHYRYMARWRLDNHRGQRRRTDSEPARRHVQQLLDAGWLQQQIADAASLNHRIVGSLLAREYATISRRNEAAILGVSGPPPRQRDVDATGTMRRVRALIAIGWPIAQLAPRLGIHRDAVGVIARGERRQVRAETADRVAAAYHTLSRTPGTSVRARRMAARRGWHGPTAWDGGAIDDPTAEPEPADDDRPLTRDELGALRRAEIRHLAMLGESTHQIAKAVGLGEGYVRDILRDLREAA